MQWKESFEIFFLSIPVNNDAGDGEDNDDGETGDEDEADDVHDTVNTGDNITDDRLVAAVSFIVTQILKMRRGWRRGYQHEVWR